MNKKEMYVLREDIFILLCSDGFIRVYKKNRNDRFAIESLYIISKIQAIILLFFKNGNTIDKASIELSQLYSIDFDKSKKIVNEIVERYSMLLDISKTLKERDGLPKELIKILTASEVKRPREVKFDFVRPKIPESIVVFISDVCKCDCIYCRVDSGFSQKNAHFIEMDVIDKIVYECDKYGIKDIELTGGDPVMHPRFTDILRRFYKLNLFVKFSTKCPINVNKLNMLKEIGVEQLQFSLDSIEENAYIRLTRTSEDYYHNIMQTIQCAVNLGFIVKIKSVITRINIEQLEKLIIFFYNIGIFKFSFQQLSCGDRAFSEQFMPEKEQFVEFDRKLYEIELMYPKLEIERSYNLEYILSDERQRKYFRPDCMAGRNGIVVQIDGSYSYCGQSFNKNLRFLNIKETCLLDAWNSRELAEMLLPERIVFRGTKCYSCNDFDICLRKRCYVRVLNASGKLYDVDPFCPYVE